MDYECQSVSLSKNGIWSVLTEIRDGKTPEEITKQILQIHAILPGQRPERQFSIPSRTNSMQQTSTMQSIAPTQSEPATLPHRPKDNTANLIDLDDTPTPSPPTKEQPDHDSNPSNPALLPLDKPKTTPDHLSEETRDKLAQAMPPSKLLHSNPAHPAQKDDALTRKDSETLEEDEFHDAES